MKKIIYLAFGLILLNAGFLHSSNPNLGTTGSQFLKLPVGARAAAMGGAYVGVCNDASSVFWNPAGFVNVKSNAAHFSHMKWFDTFDVNAASYIYKAGDLGTISVSALVLTMDKMEVTTEFSPNGTGRFFDAGDLSVGIGYGRNLTDRFRMGVVFKYIRQRIWNEVASGLAFDLGTQYQLPFKNLTIAMSMMNFGSDMRFDGPDLSVKYDEDTRLPNRLIPTRLETEYFPLPLNFEFGIAMDLLHSQFVRVTTAVDAVHPNDNRERIHWGNEVAFYDRLFLRGGYQFNHDDQSYNLGFGTTAFISGMSLSFDYAYSVYDILPDVHLMSFGINF